jgi:basic membrane protein A
MSRKGLIATALVVSLTFIGNTGFAAPPKIGASCPTLNSFQYSGSTLLVCAAKSGKKSWRKATTVEKILYLKEKARQEKAAIQKIVDDANAEAQRIIQAAQLEAAEIARTNAERMASELAAQISAAKTKAELQAAADKAAAELQAAADKAAADKAAADKAAADKAAAAAEAAAEAAAKAACAESTKKLNVGLAYDIGGRGDKSFNDSAAAGLDTAKKKLCVTATEVTVTTGSDSEREGKLRLLAKAGHNPIIAVGFLYAGPIKAVALEYPAIQFGIIDDGSVDLLNVASLVFAEEQGSYLAGVAAALASKSGKVGYIGGVRIPLLQKFEAGFVAGVKATNSKATIVVKYVTEPPDFGGFNDPAKAKVIAKGMIDSDIDVIYSVAGVSGAGNFAAATDAAKAGKKVWTIGVDSDQYLTASAEEQLNMLTSVVKRVDVAVFDLISSVRAGSSVKDLIDRSGIYGRVYGVKLGGITLSRSGGYIEGFYAKIEFAMNEISSGRLVVPTRP